MSTINGLIKKARTSALRHWRNVENNSFLINSPVNKIEKEKIIKSWTEIILENEKTKQKRV